MKVKKLGVARPSSLSEEVVVVIAIVGLVVASAYLSYWRTLASVIETKTMPGARLASGHLAGKRASEPGVLCIPVCFRASGFGHFYDQRAEPSQDAIPEGTTWAYIPAHIARTSILYSTDHPSAVLLSTTSSLGLHEKVHAEVPSAPSPPLHQGGTREAEGGSPLKMVRARERVLPSRRR